MSEHTESRSNDSIKPDTVLDATGLHCPLPLLKAKQALAGLAPGQLLEVRATDAGSWRDMASFTELSDHVLEAREQHGDVYYFWIRKAGMSHS
ncbi:sulfurtransferase TusA family protein [Vreelandella andesensis]|uniref:Sulfurtransferase TusA family protein n=1 Tax=Vreelandella andesensis TaxID=447567 RepID=A0A3S0Z220_9GAMM|nr:sulfurtransferase TusA family protein [Halomonas andesensis]RUR35011.1 sulfurtransferase TusA family protein [Halomonas andesensis]